jgi:small subunit ribosomal protein S9
MAKKIQEKTPAEKTERKDHFFYALGKRKSSIAHVRLYENGKGEITVNGHPIADYFFGELIGDVKAPLKLVDLMKRFDVVAEAIGGGISSQADAVRHGVSKALVVFDPSLRLILKRAGFITRDSRAKERKKPGLKRARRAPQWSKR